MLNKLRTRVSLSNNLWHNADEIKKTRLIIRFLFIFIRKIPLISRETSMFSNFIHAMNQ